MGHPTCIIEGLACWLTLCILEKIICNSTNSVQISFIETLKLIVFSWTIWWCYWQNVLMINEKNNFLTVSWLSGLLSAEIFISTGEWGVQMPPLTSENSYFLRSGPQGATLVMWNRQAIFESKGDKVSSSAECRIRTYGLRHQIASRLNARWQTDWAIEDQVKKKSIRQPVLMINEHPIYAYTCLYVCALTRIHVTIWRH